MVFKSDFWLGVGCMVVAVVVFILTLDMMKVPLGIGPGDYPRVVAIGLFILGGILAIQGWRNSAPVQVTYPQGALKRVFLLVLMVFLYIRLLPVLGFLLITPVFLLGAMWHFGYKKIWVMLVTSLSVTLSIYFIFYSVFKVLLPRFTLF